MSNLRHRILCSATSARYTEIIASRSVVRQLKVFLHRLSPPPPLRVDLQAQTAKSGPFFLPTMMSGCEKNMPTHTKQATRPVSKVVPKVAKAAKAREGISGKT